MSNTRTKARPGQGQTLALVVVIVAVMLFLNTHWRAILAYAVGLTPDEWKAGIDTFALLLTAAATIGLAVLAARGLAQLSLSKHDILTRARREAIRDAITQVDFFRRECIPAQSATLKALAENQIPPYSGPLSFEVTEVSAVTTAREWRELLSPPVYSQCLETLNLYESFAMAFQSRLADEEIAFGPTSDIFCRTIVQLSPLILTSRARWSNPDLYPNSVKLYLQWSARQSDARRQAQKQELLEKLVELDRAQPVQSERPLGTEL